MSTHWLARWARGPHRAGRFGARSLAASVAIATLCLTVFTGAASGIARADTTSSSVTVTGTVSGRHAWDPAAGAEYPDAPSVTVDQAENLTDQVVHLTWQHFTPSRNANGLSGLFYSPGLTDYAVTVLECRGTDPADPVNWSFPDFGPDCYAFQAASPNASNGLGNQVYTITGPSGSGEAYFHVETSVENDFLGCDSSHPCSLVVVPNWGGAQPQGSPPTDRPVACDGTKKAHSGDTSFSEAWALDTSLGLGCSWGDRFVVPLRFAPTPESCPSADYAFAAEGAPMLARTFQQWQAGWCQGSDALTFDFNSGSNEYLARQSFLDGSGALTSSVDAAIVNRPASEADAAKRAFTYAPVDNSAITVAYHIDNTLTGQLITDLTLNARLVAKLLTQSYSLAFGCDDGSSTSGPTCDPAVKGNPIDIFDDPEFQQLNPQYGRASFPAVSDLNRGQFLPLAVAGNSDLVYELTRWIKSDASAQAFISGTPDENGMHVNTYYKGETLPLDEFQTLDPGYTAPASNGVPGASTMQVAWNPITGQDNVAQSLVIDRPSAISPTLDPCGTDGTPCIYKRFAPQPAGARALFAVVGLNDAAADRFPTAKLVNAAGQAVGPTDAGLSAGLTAMTTNPDTITKSADYTSTDPAAYPLVTTSYAMVGTCGVDASKATALKAFLGRVATAQTVGLQPGQLAPGNLPLSSEQLGQAATAATAISTSPCAVAAGASPPPSTSSTGSGPVSGSNAGSDGGTGGSGGIGGTSASIGGAGSAGGAGATSGGASAHHSAAAVKKSPAPAATVLAAYGVKHGDPGGGPGFALPLLLVLTAVLVVGGPGTFLLMETGLGQQFVSGMRSGAAGLRTRLRR